MCWKYEKDGNGQQRRKPAQTTPDASFGPLVSFIYLFFVFLILTEVFIAYLVNNDGIRDREDRDDENEPKRRVWRRLGH